MRVLDLFSGVGCVAIATHLLGMETAAFVEIDPACQRLLAQRFPGVPVHGDITTLYDATLAAIGPVDFVVGGPPCQPVSVAGQRRGEDDARWLWPEMLRVVAAVRPRYVVAENPPGFVSMGLATVVAALEGLGYAVRHPEIPTAGLESDHERQRVWILAVDRANPHGGLRDGADDEIRPRWDLTLAGGPSGRADATSGGFRRGAAPGPAGQPARAGQGGGAGVGDAVAGICGVPDGVAGGLDGPTEHGADDSLDPGSFEGQWDRRYPADYPAWIVRPQPPGLTHRSADRTARLKQLGNAVYWPVVFEVLRPIAVWEGLIEE